MSKKTVGTPFIILAVYCLNLCGCGKYWGNIQFGLGGGSGGPTPMNLEVPVQLVTTSFGSAAAATVEFTNSTGKTFDPSDYDGVTGYVFEGMFVNKTASVKTVNLVNSANTTTATISIPAHTNNAALIRTAWTPTGADTYHIEVPTGGGNDNVIVWDARVLVQQSQATKTRIYIPLIMDGGSYSASSSECGHADTCQVDNWSFTGTNVWQQGPGIAYNTFTYNASAWSGLSSSPFQLEVNMQPGGANMTATLYDLTAGASVAASNITGNSNPMKNYVGSSFAASALTDGHVYTVMFEGTNAQYVELAQAGLWVTLDNLHSAEVWYLVGASNYYGGNNYSWQPITNVTDLDLSHFSNPTSYYQTSCYQLTAGAPQTIALVDQGASATTVTVAAPVISTANCALYSTITPQKLGPLTITNGHSYSVNFTVGGGTMAGSASYVVVDFHY